MTRWWGGGRAALLVAALLPVACGMKTIPLFAGGGGVSGTNGSDAGPGGGGNGNFDASSDRTGHCPGGTSNSLSYEPESPEIMLALDRSPSMGDSLVQGGRSKYSLTASAIMDVVGTYEPFVQFGYIEYPGSPNTDQSCANGCCGTGLVQPIPQNGDLSRLINQLDMCANQISCSGSQATPTGQALKKVANVFNRLTGSFYALVLTDGPPSANCPIDATSSDSACEQTTNQIFNMKMGIPSGSPPTSSISTFVMVIGTVTVDDPVFGNLCLNGMAMTGGHGRSSGPGYVQALTESSVEADLVAIVKSTICRIDITEQGFDPNLDADSVEVDYNGVPVPRDAPEQPGNGWSLDPNQRSTIVLNGTLCDNVINKGATRHLAVKGCISHSPFPAPTH